MNAKIVRYMKVFALCAVSFAVAGVAMAQERRDATGVAENDPINAVVKLEVVTAKADIHCPWVINNSGGSGSGVVIGDGKILTCAHCVAGASFIRVRKQNEDTFYHAEVLFVDNDADLALIKVEDAKFMSDITPMEVGETPLVQDDVLAIGYPMGGEDISYTRGIVSRIEDIQYSFGWTMLLGIQVDAAINLGNSGGPVLDMNSGKIAGIAFQGEKNGEALGYIIPPDIIRHFLTDIQDGRVDGFPNRIFNWSGMENATMRRYYKMSDEQTGVVVDNVDPVLGIDTIRTNDVILEVDGYKVSNSGRIRIEGGVARSLSYPIYMRQIGEKIPVKVLRDGEIIETAVESAKVRYRGKEWLYDKKPDFFLYGGFVFTTVSLDYLISVRPSFYDDLRKGWECADDEAVVISFCFADKEIDGYIGCGESLVRKVNGVKVRNLRHLVEIVDNCHDGFIRFDVDRETEWDVKIIVDAKEMRETTERVMKRHQIPADRSEDLQSTAATLERDVEFLVRYAPKCDLPLPGEYVTNNCILAAQARANAIEQYPDDIYLDYVLPYSVIREGRDDWRQEFRERFLPLIEGCTNAYEAAVILDRKIWDMIGVHYNIKRDQARQSPRHSMRIGMASCTGISIILIDACRALGIPARLVGCCWTTIPGNHSWVEVWSNGGWHVVASGEKEREDNIWFLEYAALADASQPDRRIYASRYSPSGTYFWRTWQLPGCVSDVPADDVTAKYRSRPVFGIVISDEAAEKPEWKAVAEALKEKHCDEAWSSIFTVAPTNALQLLRSIKPDYVAFVMMPEEVNTNAYHAIKHMMRSLDDNPYDDALYGIITGPNAATALRIARSREPKTLERILATTSVEPDIVPGQVAVISDAFPKGEYWEKSSDGDISRHSTTNSTSPVFADAWNTLDPDILLTSSHATEHNLEMAFSQGAIISSNGVFYATSWPMTKTIDDAVALKEAKREKVWLAAGNCLIANHVDNYDMVMTALSFGKVNQFIGYFKPTWFGFVGWTTWRNFSSGDLSLVDSYFAANKELLRKLETGDWQNEQEKAGLEWDRDATIFYGDPMLDIRFSRVKPK